MGGSAVPRLRLEIREIGNNAELPIPQRIERLENLIRDLVGEMNSVLQVLEKELDALRKENER